MSALLPQSLISTRAVPELLGRYRVLERIGAGGMGEVFRGRDEHLDREVAIKVLSAACSADQDAHRRLRAEARILSKLNHPNIALVYDFDSSQGIDFLVMEFVSGITLADRLRSGPLPQQELVSLARQLLDGLAAAHAHGIVHRDLKPGNVMLTDEKQLKILDFGLATLQYRSGGMTPASDLAPGVSGTVPYMAPERLRGGPVDERSDLYSLGVILYEMATARRPFIAVSLSALVAEILTLPPPPPSKLHEGPANREAIRMLERVVESDPNYAPAWSALAERYYYDSLYFGGREPVARQAQAAAERAVQLDPGLVSATTQLVVLLTDTGQLDRAYRQAQTALRLHPDSGLAHFAAGYVLRYAGLFEEAAKGCDAALGLDPTNYQFRSCAITLEMIGQYSRAMDFARLDWGTDFATWRTTYINLDTGNLSAALTSMKPLLPSYFEAQLGTECIQHPNSPLLKRLSAGAEAMAGTAGRAPENIYLDARIQAFCLQNATALMVLRRAVEGGYCAYPIMDNDPLLSQLRTTPQFAEIRKLGMECQARFLRYRSSREAAQRSRQ